MTATSGRIGSTTYWISRRPRWTGYLAGVWSLAYGLLGLWWTVGGAGFPFGRENDPSAALSVFAGARAEVGGPVIAVLGFAGSLVAVAMIRAWGRGTLRAVLLAFAWTVVMVLTLVVPDYRVLVAVAYAPIFLVGAPFGYPPAGFFEAIPWPVINQFLCIGGGFLWAMTAVAYGRHTRDACEGCGRTEGDAGWAPAAVAARWGRWAVAVAVLVPVLYAITRWAWALGIPLGISEKFLREGQEVGLWWAGAGLATIAVGGAVLTLGLVQRWGEVFPRWIPFVGGRRVPIALAVVPALAVSVLVTAAGLMFVRLTVTGRLEVILGEGVLGGRNWATLAPELLWPLWGVALAVAALAYYRRRGRCERCGRS